MSEVDERSEAEPGIIKTQGTAIKIRTGEKNFCLSKILVILV
jgi:hypothetical protein